MLNSITSITNRLPSEIKPIKQVYFRAMGNHKLESEALKDCQPYDKYMSKFEGSFFDAANKRKSLICSYSNRNNFDHAITLCDHKEQKFIFKNSFKDEPLISLSDETSGNPRFGFYVKLELL